MAQSVATKMGLKQGMRAIFLHAPADALAVLEPPPLDRETTLAGDFDYAYVFVKNQAAFQEHFPALKNHLKPTGMRWVSWPKAGQEGTDLTLKTVIKLGYGEGLVERKCISINALWSALTFTHPKQGNAYANRYGKLPQ